MTITIAWERKLANYSEIILCSDSRLSGGGNIDVCQKVFALPREDAAIGFCGSTIIAYPLMHQFNSYIKHSKKNFDRALDGSALPQRFCALCNQFLEFYIDPVDLESDLRATSFIIAYFSWKHKRPFVYRIAYEKSANRYVAIKGKFPKTYSMERHNCSQFVMLGDYRPEYFAELGKLADYEQSSDWNLEPFQALCNLLSNAEFTNRRGSRGGKIGGAPQFIKIYPFLKTIEFGVYWPSKIDDVLYINGRKTFNYEKIFVPRIDAKTMEFQYPLGEVDKTVVPDFQRGP